ncbi:hypothetical protein CVT24_004907 [Panaeolus cyanescens]|uniref:Pet127-domain-containing protein n=1 Tax=Panaeolus cyanescens TaxID=181874 RepID=A0A409YB21_9AGAR|nr:hypothetical protein CVT24_004907 [Panaeolus cyanescens]
MRSWTLQRVLKGVPHPLVTFSKSLDTSLKGTEAAASRVEKSLDAARNLDGKSALNGRNSLSARLSQSLLKDSGRIQSSPKEVPSASDILNKERTIPTRERTPERIRRRKKVVRAPPEARAQLSKPKLKEKKNVVKEAHAKSELLKQQKAVQTGLATGFTHDSSLVPETWASEPWKYQASSLEKFATRLPPPHIEPETALRTGVIDNLTTALVDVPPVSEHHPVAKLSHGLDRVLFNPGVHWLQDPRSRVYNFTPWLESIPKVNDFAFERLTGFIKSSRDEDLRELAERHNKKFAGSTSSLSGMLSHIYFLISEHKQVELTTLSQHFRHESPNFTSGQKMPATVVLNYKDGTYAIDSHSAEWDDPDKNILTWMGTLLENLLTKTPSEFQKFIRKESEPIEHDEEAHKMREAYRYAKSDKFVMRSQLDCQDKRLPGTGVFDIKTRACVSVRMDILNYEENAGYLIKSQYGLLESFEKEYYDLIRSAFLKYSFQVRIGNMDGVMVTYHNTERIFGFQYISLDEMDERLLGPVPGMGDKVFRKSVKLLEEILESATALMPNEVSGIIFAIQFEKLMVCILESVKVSFETRVPGTVLRVYVQPEQWDKNLGPTPIESLNVRVRHFLDGEEVRASAALRSVEEDWTMSYEITRSTLPQEVIQVKYEKLEGRKKRSFVLPSSISLAEAQAYWDSISFHKRDDAEERSIKPSVDDFTLANAAIEQFRHLSREGRQYSQQIEKQYAGKPKVVLGSPSPDLLEEPPELVDSNDKTLSDNGP